MRTAKAVKSLLANCDGKEPTALVGTIAHGKIETNCTAMGRSLKSAKAVLECLGRTRWDLFSAVSQLADHRKTDAELLVQDVCTWLKNDEHAIAGGLAGKLSDAEGRAIKLLTPPRKEDRNHERHEKGREEKRDRMAGTVVCSTPDEFERTIETLRRKWCQHPACRLTIEWSLDGW